jgi:hypothetical protein
MRWALAPLVIALTMLGLQPATSAAASTGSASQTSAHSAYPWKGQGPSCAVRLPIYGSISYKSFTTCPPKRVLLIGDSVALTMGIEMSINEENWGTLIENASVKDCGFVTGYSVVDLGNVTPTNSQCNGALKVWTKDAHRFKPQAIVVEMGWWDSFQHLINGAVVSLSQLQYVAMVEQQMHALINGLRSASAAPIYFLSVPWMNPGQLPNGQPEPAASATSHDDINSLIQTVAQSSDAVHFVNVAPFITPSGAYEAQVGGGQCRSADGIELYYTAPQALRYVQTPCGKALQKGLLSTIRQGLKQPSHRHN